VTTSDRSARWPWSGPRGSNGSMERPSNGSRSTFIPSIRPEGIPREELHRRYPEDVHERTRHMVEAAGLSYNPPSDVVPNSRQALELTELAARRGSTTRCTLGSCTRTGRKRGTSAIRTRSSTSWPKLGSTARKLPPRSMTGATPSCRRLHDPGATGRHQCHSRLRPRRRLLLLGAQPHEIFERALEQVGRAPSPKKCGAETAARVSAPSVLREPAPAASEPSTGTCLTAASQYRGRRPLDSIPLSVVHRPASPRTKDRLETKT
jgi:hypothetical protein